MSIVYPANDPFLIQELEKLHSLISGDVKIIIGGRVSNSYTDVIRKIDAMIIDDLDEFKEYLEIQNN